MLNKKSVIFGLLGFLVLLGFVSYFSFRFDSVSESQEFLNPSDEQAIIEEYDKCGDSFTRGEATIDGEEYLTVQIQDNRGGSFAARYCETGSSACRSGESGQCRKIQYHASDGRWVVSARTCATEDFGGSSISIRALCTSDGESGDSELVASVIVNVNGSNGQIIIGANVDFLNGGPDGNFNVPGVKTANAGHTPYIRLPAGRVTIKVSKEGYRTEERVINIVESTTNRVSFNLLRSQESDFGEEEQDDREDEGSNETGGDASVASFKKGQWCGYWIQEEVRKLFSLKSSWSLGQGIVCGNTDMRIACPDGFERIILRMDNKRVISCVRK